MAETISMTKNALWIINPVAGRKIITRHIPSILRLMMKSGYAVTTMVTGRGGEAAELAARYGAGRDLVICSGGDGTLNETVTGLLDSGISVPVGYIPCGTTNDFSASRGLPRDILSAARCIAAGHITVYDVGRFADRYFMSSALFGAFSWMAYSTDQNLKNTLGYAAYVLDGVTDLSRLQPVRMRFTADGQEMEDDYIFGAVSNASALAGIIELPVNRSHLSDGMLELTLIRAPRNLAELDVAVRSILSRDYSGPFLSVRQVRELRVECPAGTRWSLDGEEYVAGGAAAITPVPGALHLQG